MTSLARVADPSDRPTALFAAARRIEQSWARPGRWHAGAQEALSWTYAALAVSLERVDLAALSADAAQRSLARAPVQPAPWTRLAQFEVQGVANGLCHEAACLSRSWRAVELAPLSTYCARLRLGHERGDIRNADDAQIAMLTRLNVAPDVLRQCVSFLSSAEVDLVLERQDFELDRQQRVARETGRSPFLRPYH